MKLTQSAAVEDNLHFLIAEVSLQINSLSLGDVTASGQRINYIQNLKSRITLGCQQQRANPDCNEQDVSFLHSIETSTLHLERIADLCLETYPHQHAWKNSARKKNDRLCARLIRCLTYIETCYNNTSAEDAIKLLDECNKIKKNCSRRHDEYRQQLQRSKKINIDQLLSLLFFYKNINAIADYLMKIAESLLSVSTGLPVTASRYSSYAKFIQTLKKSHPQKKFTLQNLADTKSGNTVTRIVEAHNDDVIAVMKDGKKRKLKEERQGVENWQDIFPGIAPRILDFKKQGGSAALMIEHLTGDTFENIMLHGSDKSLDQAITALLDTLDAIWNKTRRNQPAEARFMQQLKKRLADVYRIHSGFLQQSCEVAGVTIASFEQLINDAERFENTLAAPFSVYIHGDFNIDNILFDLCSNKVNFIDLHRSRHTDMVQDISVFMVSNYRLQSLDPVFRKRVQSINLKLYNFASDFAAQHQDALFDVRLALGLARSFATSTRFVLDTGLSHAMFYRARYLLEQISTLKNKQLKSYNVPVEELFRA